MSSAQLLWGVTAAQVRDFCHLASPITTLIGLLVSTWGSYRLAVYYHRFRGSEFWKSVGNTTWLFLTFQRGKLQDKIRIIARTGKHKEEDRTDSITGVYLLFAGFVLQVFGALCWCIESNLDIFGKH